MEFETKILSKGIQEMLYNSDKTVGTAESCTGGLVAACLTAIAGSSAVFDRGFVTYSNESKTAMLGVDPALIALHGAVSVEVAQAMARGALAQSHALLSISITGIAGPGGGSDAKPVGTVCFGLATRSSCVAERRLFPDHGRDYIRLAALDDALERIILAIKSQTNA